jgi:AsmA protein
VELVPDGKGVVVRKVDLRADGTAVSLTGRITDLAGPAADLTVKATGLNLLQIVAFANDFSSGAGLATSPAAPAPAAAPRAMNISIAIEADRALVGTLALEKVQGRVLITAEAVTLEPIRFSVFGGGYDGSMALALGAAQAYHLKAALSGVDMAAMTAFVGHPGTISGRLSGTIDIAGRGTAADQVLQTARGSARVELADGSIKGLGLVRGLVLATSMRKESMAQVPGSGLNEPFSKMSGTFTIANGAATTDNLRFESRDLLVSAAGVIRLDGRAVDMAGPVQLSSELSQQAGRDLVRYTQKDGRVTVPATVTGSLESLHVGIDVGDMAKRALTNRASEEAKKALQKGLIKIIK